MKHDMIESEKDKNGKQSYNEMCSSGYVTAGQMYSLLSSDTYRSGMLSASGEHVEIPYRT